MKASAWKITSEKNSPHCIYWMQVDKVKPRSMTKIKAALGKWDNIGSGSNSDGDILLFKRDFGDQEKWADWAKDFDAFDLVELGKDGQPKNYVKIGAKSKGGRTCGKCGNTGHNARTCGGAGGSVRAVKASGVGRGRGKRTCASCGLSGHNARTCGKPKLAAKAMPKGQRRCGKCGDLGHNARTCGKA